MGAGKGRARRVRAVHADAPSSVAPKAERSYLWKGTGVLPKGPLASSAVKLRILRALDVLYPVGDSSYGVPAAMVCEQMGLSQSQVHSVAGHLHSLEVQGQVQSRSMQGQNTCYYWSLVRP